MNLAALYVSLLLQKGLYFQVLLTIPHLLLIYITALYSFLTITQVVAWLRIKTFKIKHSHQELAAISVVIAVRNEEDTILTLLQDLNKQHYSAGKFEVIIVDDYSTDLTVSIVQEFRKQATYSLRLLELKDYLGTELIEGNYKKKAIEIAVQQASGVLIVTTDGDCRVGENWLTAIGAFHQQHQAQFICGPVTFEKEKTFFEHLQTVEFASLVSAGAALLQMGLPAMCNGANLAYTKEAFLRVGGYVHTKDSPSGDDIFLLQKINLAYPGKAFFLKSKDALVHTRAKTSWQNFYQQRKRWASKWNLYQDKRVSVLAVFIFICNFSLLVGLVLVLSGNYPLRMFLMQIAIRFSAEFVFLTLVLRFLKKDNFIAFILPLQLVYFLYVSLFGFVAHKKGYEWKGRKLK